MKPWQQRRTDFGQSQVPCPDGMNLMEMTMPDGSTWRVELDNGETDTYELRAELERQAQEFTQFAKIMIDSYT